MLLGQISKLVAVSGWSTSKQSSVQAADEQLREIKKLVREEPKSFKWKGNKIHSTTEFNTKLQDSLDKVKSHHS